MILKIVNWGSIAMMIIGFGAFLWLLFDKAFKGQEAEEELKDCRSERNNLDVENKKLSDRAVLLPPCARDLQACQDKMAAILSCDTWLGFLGVCAEEEKGRK